LITGDNIEDTSMMPLFIALFILCMTVSVSSAETLKQVLLAKQIPITSFQESELNQNVQSLAAIHNETVEDARGCSRDERMRKMLPSTKGL